MTQLSNQFKQSPVKGQLDLRLNIQTLGVQVGPDFVGSLTPGQAVKIVDSPAGGVPKVTACTVDEDDVYGFVNYDPRTNSYGANDYLSISFFKGNVMYMEADAALGRNVEVMIVVTGSKVTTATSTNRIVGRTIDKASAQGDLIRVLINLPGALA